MEISSNVSTRVSLVPAMYLKNSKPDWPGRTRVSEEALKAMGVSRLFLDSFCLALPMGCHEQRCFLRSWGYSFTQVNDGSEVL